MEYAATLVSDADQAESSCLLVREEGSTIFAVLTASELALGSFLHGLHIPFSGQLLSLNQCFWLNIAKGEAPPQSALRLSLQVAAVKAMSPFGKRVTPMIAISMQGLLFEIGFQLGGGLAGTFLASFWSFFQPLILFSLYFGSSFWEMLNYFTALTGFGLAACLTALFSLKMLLAAAVYWLARTLSEAKVLRFGYWLRSLEKKMIPKGKKRGSRSLLFVLALLGCYFFFVGESWESALRRWLFTACWSFAVYAFLDRFGIQLFQWLLQTVRRSPTEISHGADGIR